MVPGCGIGKCLPSQDRVVSQYYYHRNSAYSRKMLLNGDVLTRYYVIHDGA